MAAAIGASPGHAGPALEGDAVARWRPYVEEASRRFGVPAPWIEQVIRAESGGRTTLNGRPIVSPAGAMGLMQLMPATWSALRAAHGLGGDPFDPRDNILAGAAYLAALYRRFGYPGLFGAYNAGPARYAAWLAGRAPLPGETRAYLARLGAGRTPARLFASGEGASAVGQTGRAAVSKTLGGSARGGAAETHAASIRSRLFAVDRAVLPTVPAAAESPANGLFVVLSCPASAPAGN